MNILKFNHLKNDNFNILTQSPLWKQWKNGKSITQVSGGVKGS